MKTTPLTDWHIRSGARMIDFFGFHMPVIYTSISAEVEATRRRCGLFDLTHMGRLEISGEDREAVARDACTKDVTKVPLGAARYGLLLTEQGTVKDDVLVYREADLVHVVINCSNRDPDHRHFLDHVRGRRATVRNVSDEQTMIALQGPLAGTILAPHTDTDLAGLGYYRFCHARVAGAPVLLSRTGYTGEDGFEIFSTVADGPRLFETLLAAGKPHGLLPVGLGARDVLRLEAAMPLYGQELTTDLNPLEADVAFGVSMKSDFTGKAALVAVEKAGVARRRIGFESVSKRVPRTGMDILSGGAKVGHVTSGTASPTLGRSIGMGYVPVGLAAPGTELSVDAKGTAIPVKVVEMPFYKRER
ncbi:MAG: glycine cleavage system aminomethyltransferase GcvT [Planctomycetes bacterium]|jgi:aminomethyltransferase|nr:glycine cleavage system aminomethyltransferase GcvT [Planctomycetota bacterium]